MKNFLALTIVGIFIVIGLWSLITNSFYTSHDGFTHTARIAAYYQALNDGQFPPRWGRNFNGNFGSPIFIYSYPLPYFLGSVAHAAGFDYQSAFRLVIGLSFVLAGVSAYFWLGHRFGVLAGLVGAVYYLWIPYRFLNLYVRGALAESLAYGLVPLVFLGLDKKWWKFTTLALAAVLLSHNETAALTLPVFLAWAFMHKKLKFFAAAFLLALSVSAFIYLPDFLERGYTIFDRGISYYRDHFVSLWQFVRSPWGFGFDLPGAGQDGMSFQLGLGQIGAVLLLLVLTGKKILRLETLFFLGLLAVTVFLMLDHPLVIKVWETLPVMRSIVDFPWRFLGLTTIAFAFLAAVLVASVKYAKAIAFGLLLMAVVANRNHLRVNLAQNFSDRDFEEFAGSPTAVSNEYLPVWRLDHLIAGRPAAVEVIDGGAVISSIRSNASQLSWSVYTVAPVFLRINRFYFPKTSLSLNGQDLVMGTDWDIIRTQNLKEYDDSGLIRVFVDPPGGSFLLKFQETPLRQAADYLSLGTAAFIIFLVWKRKSIV